MVTKNREEILHSHQSVVPEPLKSAENGQRTTLYAGRSLSTIPKASNSIKVYYNNSTQSVDRETYIYTVLSSELYGKSYYSNKGLSDTQINELYVAQAIAANTFLEYSLSVYSNHSGKNYKVCSTTCCQVYDPTKVTQAAIDATTNVFYTIGVTERTLLVLHKPSSSTFDYIWGAFFSSCYGKGTKTHSSQAALQSVSCTDIATGAGGHRYGMCQMGAATLAKDGKVARDILLHYYTDCCVASCVLN